MPGEALAIDVDKRCSREQSGQILECDRRSISVDAMQLGVNGPPSDLSTLLGDSTEPTLHIVRDSDQATTDEVERLADYFEALVHAMRRRPVGKSRPPSSPGTVKRSPGTR